MKKLFAIMSSLSAVLLFTACESSETPEIKNGVRFHTAITPPSRASESNFDPNDAIGVFAVKASDSANGQLYPTNYADNVKYIYDGAFFTADNPIYLPDDDSELFYHAVYPYSENCGSEFIFNVSQDQNLNNNYTLSDLMTATTDATSEEVPALVFNHRLSNIIINIEYEERPAGTERLAINNVLTGVDVDLNRNTYKGIGETSYVTMASNGTNSFRAILPPQNIAAGTEIIYLTVGNRSFSAETESSLEWRSGKQYTYNLYISKNGEISFTSIINPWDTTVDIEEIVPPSILDEMEVYIPIHRGTNPPYIEGVYWVEPEVVYCSDENNGGYAPGSNNFYDHLSHFFNQNNHTLTLDYEQKDENGSYSLGTGSFICGSSDKFTVYFDTEGISYHENYEAWNKTALIISGTLVNNGISGLQYAFVMVEKEDPNNILMEEGEFRIFKDMNDLATTASWDMFSAIETRLYTHDNVPSFQFIRSNKIN